MTPSPLRWWLASTIGPELVALVLSVVLGLAIVFIMGLSRPSGGPGSGTPGPSAVPTNSQSPAMLDWSLPAKRHA